MTNNALGRDRTLGHDAQQPGNLRQPTAGIASLGAMLKETLPFGEQWCGSIARKDRGESKQTLVHDSLSE
jgi:hypothetical protein